MDENGIRPDHRVILELIEAKSRVLDLGCGTGELLYILAKERDARGQGIEIDEQAIYQCVAKGLDVLHGDIDSGLSEFREKYFDYVILNQSLQQVRHVDTVLADALRVGRKVIVGVPNFAHYKARLQLFFRGRVPVTLSLPYAWHETPNLHFLSLYDFLDYCADEGIKVEKSVFLKEGRRVRMLPNLFADKGVFLISK
jgi:methionine biosynthesis protein MetW